MRALMDYISRSTLKREFALFLVLWLLSGATYLILAASVSDMQFRILELFAYPILVGAFGVFGLDWVAKQTTLAGPPANTETTVKVEKLVDPETTTVTTTTEDKP